MHLYTDRMNHTSHKHSLIHRCKTPSGCAEKETTSRQTDQQVSDSDSDFDQSENGIGKRARTRRHVEEGKLNDLIDVKTSLKQIYMCRYVIHTHTCICVCVPHVCTHTHIYTETARMGRICDLHSYVHTYTYIYISTNIHT